MLINSFQALSHPTTPYEAQTLRFCEDWLSGRSSFSIHTSGSTGTPKLMELSRSQMLASAKLTGQTFGLGRGTHALCCLNTAYIAGMMMLVRAMELGMSICVIEPQSNPFLENIHQKPIDFAAFVPLQLQTMLSESPESRPWLNAMQTIIVGGAAVNATLLPQIEALSVPVYATYGMTETVSHIAVKRLNGSLKSAYFQVLSGVEIATDHRDCLKIKAAATNNNWIQTNDIVHITDTGFELLGRFDNIINSGGVKISLEKVEAAFEPFFPNQRFFAWGIDDEKLGQKLVVVMEKTNTETIDFEDIIQQIGCKLSKYEIPKALLVSDVFEMTPTQKIDKKATFAKILTP